MDDQDELLEDPEVGVNLSDPNQDVIDEYAIPQDDDEQQPPGLRVYWHGYGINSLPPPETSSWWVGLGRIRRVLFNCVNCPRKIFV